MYESNMEAQRRNQQLKEAMAAALKGADEAAATKQKQQVRPAP